MPVSRRVKCGHCGMTYFTRYKCTRCMFGERDPDCPDCHGTLDVGPAPKHVCPEPFPYEIAKSMAATRCLVSSTTMARVRLGLKLGPR